MDFLDLFMLAATIVVLLNFFIWFTCEFIPYVKRRRTQKKQRRKAMLNRKELEELLGHPITDAQWAENVKIMSEIADKMWEEDHPLDE